MQLRLEHADLASVKCVGRHQLSLLCCLVCLLVTASGTKAQSFETPRKIDGYRGIWFDLGQKSQYGSKYSGGLGTYTAKHHPLAIYAPQVDKTFFVYGGTTEPNSHHLLAMISYYDHETGLLPKPTVVHDKQTVNDPHDNPSLALDPAGHLWVFVSGRGRVRPGFIYRSRRPYDIDAFELVSQREITYPQPHWLSQSRLLHLFTKYTHGRELYWATSPDGRQWSDDHKLAGMGGHYQMSSQRPLDDGSGDRVITAFNMHPSGSVDLRTNLYFVQSDNGGMTWQNVAGDDVDTPLVDAACTALVHDYRRDQRLVYLKDIGFDAVGNPVLMYVTSDAHTPGPQERPRRWTIAHWRGSEWQFGEIADAQHNYDMGSLYIEPDQWRVIAPTEPGPQPHGTGGEIAIWSSNDEGATWRKVRQLTIGSERNHGYVRRPVAAHDDFYGFWADGNPNESSPSHLYFCDRAGDHVWRLPYDMNSVTARPELVGPPRSK
ncbi:MAG: BNR-4 repeat-containing protein [Planctomycetales bacterium]|nr:BNR-4 repeat-containing protein [Planctomycetales bacterium]